MSVLPARGWVRAIVVVLVCASVGLLLSLDPVYDALQRLLTDAESLIGAHPYAGAVVFVVFTAVSAILAFFSSTPLLPAATFAWGNALTLVLLWFGWLLGGAGTYALGRGLRGTGEGTSQANGRLSFYLQRLPDRLTFSWVLLLHLALPSEIPGYLCGYVGVRTRTYLAALALAELPYAVGAVALADGVVKRNVGGLVVLGVVAAALSLYVLRALHARLGQSPAVTERVRGPRPAPRGPPH